MKKIFLIFIFTLFVYGQDSISELRDCYSSGDETCGINLAKELNKSILTSKEGGNILLALTLGGNKKAPTELGKYYIYNSKQNENCEKGLSFLMIGSKTDPQSIKELALLFKRGVCVEKNELKFKKYMKIYISEKNKIKNSY